MPRIDMEALAELIRQDRTHLALSQTDYGRRLRLTQRQITDLERAVQKQPSRRVCAILRRYFRRLPLWRAPTTDVLIDRIKAQVDASFGRMRHLNAQDRLAVAEHLMRQIQLLSLLSELRLRRKDRPLPLLFGRQTPRPPPENDP